MKNYKLFTLFILSAILISCGSKKSSTPESNTSSIETSHENDEVLDSQVNFNINLNDRSNDTFKVSAKTPQLTSENKIFQFASTAPGTYQVMNIGRFVKGFKAFDKKGNEIPTTHITTNQFEISQPEKVRSISYEISETYDTKVDSYPVYAMAGTSIENDHTLINGQAVFGYFTGLQGLPINISIEYPETWMAGTALKLNTDGTYTADNYDHVVDSPILLGNLTKASTDVEGTTIDIYTYSAKGMVKSEQVLETLEGMLKSASKFLNGLPVDRYTFLIFLENNNINPKGAWEHSYSSEYTLDERPWDKMKKGFKDTAAHEFFHIVTPLNIHSEIIEEFNFVKPVSSRHLWLYEGTTEWASHMMLFRSGEKSLEEYFKVLRRKVYISKNYFKGDFNILEVSLNSFDPETQKQYPNVYMQGALIAGLLDIRLLELSNGKRGLIDVVNELAQKYGPKKSFNDATFFDEFVDFTHPEIEQFMNSYIKNGEELPLKKYFQKVGVTYDPGKYTFELDENATDEQVALRNHWMKAL